MTHLDRFMLGLLLGFIGIGVLKIQAELVHINREPIIHCYTMSEGAPYITEQKMPRANDGAYHYWIETEDGSAIRSLECYIK
jgi:hypothetical protein